jgi:hypothetical protein
LQCELLQKRYVELVDLVRRLAHNKNPIFKARNPSHIKEMDEEVAQTEQKLIDAITITRSRTVLEANLYSFFGCLYSMCMTAAYANLSSMTVYEVLDWAVT